MKISAENKTLLLLAPLAAIILLGSIPVARATSSPASPVPSRNGVPFHGTHSLNKISGTSGVTAALKPAAPGAITNKNDIGSGYTVDEGSGLNATFDSFIVPSATCNPSSSYLQAVFVLAWLDGFEGERNYVGVQLVCAQGASGSAAIYGYDSVNTYTGINAGDNVESYVFWNGTTIIFYLDDFTSGASFADYCRGSCSGGSPALSDGSVGTFRSTGCSTASGLCPVANFGTVKTGYAYTGDTWFFNLKTVDSNAVVYDDHIYTFGTGGFTLYKDIMVNVAGTQTDVATSGFASSTHRSSWSSTFKHPGP